MKTRKILAVILVVLALSANAFSQNIGVAINSDGAAPNNSSILDVSSATKGFLPPRMTNAQKTAIASPATGLIVWCSNCGSSGELQIFNGTTWTNTIGGVAAALTPGAPTIGTATAGTAQATVAFTAPVSNGGSAITSYTATSSPGGITGTLSQAGSGTITVTGLAVGTAYTFTVTATAASGTGPASAASNSVTPVAVAPGAPTNVIATAGDKKATVTFTAPASNGGSAITSYTVYFLRYGNPASVTQTGSGPIIITELLNGTAITFTVKATNAVGTGPASTASNSVTPAVPLTDASGNIYGTVTIGTQVWMDKNLNTTKYNDGTPIANVTDAQTWWNTTKSGAWCDYSNNASNGTTYGKLYNWYAVDNTATKVFSNGGKNICPVGWRVPSDGDWTILTNYLGGLTVSGGKLKETGTTHWLTPNTGATNSSSFTALPGGATGYGSTWDMGNTGYWWTTTAYQTNTAWYRSISSSSNEVVSGHTYMTSGYSVRCLKN